jgi:hypothetical protein
MALAERVQAEPTFDSNQQSLTFSYSADAAARLPAAPGGSRLAHTITARNAPACDAVAPAEVGPTPTAVAAGIQTHEVWIEDASSASARLAIASADNVRGVAAWRLGLEDPGVWPVITQWRQPAMQERDP